jgi:hypothetical protein
MPLIPQSYYARRARQSHIAMKAAANAGARLAHAQLKAAYQTLDQADRPVLRLRGYEPVPSGVMEPHGLASVVTAGDPPQPEREDETEEEEGDSGR